MEPLNKIILLWPLQYSVLKVLNGINSQPSNWQNFCSQQMKIFHHKLSTKGIASNFNCRKMGICFRHTMNVSEVRMV